METNCFNIIIFIALNGAYRRRHLSFLLPQIQAIWILKKKRYEKELSFCLL